MTDFVIFCNIKTYQNRPYPSLLSLSGSPVVAEDLDPLRDERVAVGEYTSGLNGSAVTPVVTPVALLFIRSNSSLAIPNTYVTIMYAEADFEV